MVGKKFKHKRLGLEVEILFETTSYYYVNFCESGYKLSIDKESFKESYFEL